jgi:hypothetical protein
MVSIKQDHEQDSLMVGVEDGIVAGISGTVVHGGGEQRPPTLQVEHPSYKFVIYYYLIWRKETLKIAKKL